MNSRKLSRADLYHLFVPVGATMDSIAAMSLDDLTAIVEFRRQEEMLRKVPGVPADDEEVAQAILDYARGGDSGQEFQSMAEGAPVAQFDAREELFKDLERETAQVRRWIWYAGFILAILLLTGLCFWSVFKLILGL